MLKRYLPFLIIGAVLLIAIVGGVVWFRSERQQPTIATNTTTEVAADPGHVRGEANAPVTLEEFGDFQCPPCGRLYPDLKKIEADYGTRLRVVFRNFPLMQMHKHALEAAHAAEAAALQGKFWEMHDMLYENQKDWSEAENVRPIFLQYARTLGLSVESFDRDMDSTQVSRSIINDLRRGETLQVKATPTILVNGHEVPYSATFSDDIRAAINAAAAGK